MMGLRQHQAILMVTFALWHLVACQVEGTGAGVHMTGASTETDPDLKAVAGAVVFRAGRVPFCSGSWIAPGLFLTAAHCFVDDEGNQSKVYGELAVLGYETNRKKRAEESQVGLEGELLQVLYDFTDREVVVHPSFPPPRDKNAGDALDLAVVRIPARVNQSFAAMPDLSGSSLQAGGAVYLYGFGHTGMVKGRVAPDGVLRAATFGIVGLDKSSKYLKIQLTSETGARTCGMDSGAPYLQRVNGRVVQIGVHSNGGYLSLGELSELADLWRKRPQFTPEESNRFAVLQSKIQSKDLEYKKETQCSDYAEGYILTPTAVEWIRKQSR